MQAMPISRVDGGDLLIWRMTSIILGLHSTVGLTRVSKLCSASRTLRCGEDATLPWTFADEGSLSAASPSRGQGMGDWASMTALGSGVQTGSYAARCQSMACRRPSD